MELVWDGRRFKDILLDSRYQGDLNQVIREVTTLSSVSGANHPKHFFEVELRGVARHKNDILLNEHEITDYLAQVAPVPFHPSFTQGDKINERLQSFGLGNSYEIFVRSTATEVAEPKQVFRPYRNTFTVFGGNKDRVRNIDFLEWTGLDGNVAAIAWALNHNYLGAIPKSEGVRGLRLRSGNIQVGSDEILADVFPEPRFNSWMIGEIHTITPKLIPNGRRDAFEANVHYTNLVGHASAYAKLVAKTCRDRSKIRNQERRFNLEKEKLHEKLALISRSSLPRSMKDKFRGEIALHVKVLEKLVNSISGQTLRKRLENELVQIKTRAGKNLDEVLLRDPLARLPKKHQELYRETIGLIFECAPNRNVASALVERMLAKLVRKC
jgi:molecular chaperone HtpG